MNNRNIYSEQEAAQIIQKAARLQERLNPSDMGSLGVTIDELKRMAQECGISAEAVEQALIAPDDHSKTSFFNLVEEQELVFEGELDENSMGEVLESLLPVAKMAPVMSMGKTHRFQVLSGMVSGQMTLSSRNGRTRLNFRQSPFVAYFAGLHLPLILSLALGANLFAHGMVVPGFLTVFGLLGLGCGLFAYLAKSGKRKARALVERMSEMIGGVLSRKTDSP